MKRFADSHVHMKISELLKAEEYLDTLASVGVTDVSLLALSASPNYDIVQNLSVLYWKEKYKKIKIRAFGSLHETDIYKNVPYEKQVETLLDLGCDGIKFLHMKPDMRKLLGKGINHPDYDKALSILEERGTPVVVHSGDPETFWDITRMTPYEIERGWYYGDGTFLTREEIYQEDFEMLKKHPKLKVSFAHFFFLSNFPDEAERVLNTYPNVRFDLTPGWEMYIGFSKDIDRWQRIFEDYSDRILFGTDSNNNKSENRELNQLVRSALTHDKTIFNMPCFGGREMRGLDLSDSTVEKITYKNYIDFVGEERASVDIGRLKSVAVKMMYDIKDIPDESESLLWIDNFIKNA